MNGPEQIILHAAAEMASWARHYDESRIQLTVLILALSGGAVSYAIAMRDDLVRVWLLIATALIGITLSGLVTEYTRLYYERANAETKLRQLATEYLPSGPKDPSSFNEFKVTKKAYQAYIEAFECPLPSIDNLRDEKAIEVLEDDYGGFGIGHWRGCMENRLRKSVWVWLNVSVGFILPVLCLIGGIRRQPDEA